MAAPEILFCSMLQANYSAIVLLINGVIKVPLFALAILKSTVQRLKLLVYAIVEAGIDVILSKLDELFALINIRSYDSGYNFCQVAFACEAIMELLFDSNLLSFLSDEAKEEALTNYERFEFFVCKNGLLALITAWIGKQLEVIEAQLDLLEEKLLGVVGIDELIQKYMDLLGKPIIGDRNIFDLLDELDKFAQCGFEVCNFIATSDNKKADYYEQLSIEKQGDSYVFVANEAIAEFIESDARINLKIQKARLKIQQWRDDQLRDEGTPIDEIMQ